MTFQVFTAPELCRVITNANGFVPARSKTAVVRYEVGPGLTVTAADPYVVGIDFTDGDEPLEGVPADIVLAADDSKELEKWIRGQKRARINLEVCLDGFAYIRAVSMDTAEIVLFREHVDEIDPAKWRRWFDAVDAVMEPLERRSEKELRLPDAIAFQPARLAAFSKVRANDGELAVMDLRIYDAESPVHVKIGDSFRGAIQPITRDKAREGALHDG